MTGSRKGIGRHLAEHLLAEGYGVFGCSREPADWSADRYTHVEADVTDEEQVKALTGRIADEAGGLYAVINNAGAASMNHALLTPDATVDKLLGGNVRSTFLVSREAAKLMRKAKKGRIVNMSSVAVPLALAGQSAYVAAKGAVEHLSRVLAAEFAEYGITVNVVGPTPIPTDMTRGVPAEKLERLVGMLPIQRLGTVEEVANVVDFFLRPESDGITGQVIYLGGASG